MDRHPGVTIVRTFADFDLWLGHAVRGRSKRHQLWLGRPGKGKTVRLHWHVRNSVGADLFPHRPGRVEAPIYGGRVTPSKFFVRVWQHHLEPLLCVNDLLIRRVDPDWEGLLCQLLEAPGPRTIRWDLRSRAGLEPEDRREIARYLRQRGLLDEFLDEQRERAGDEDDEGSGPGGRLGRSLFRGSLPELAGFDGTYGDEEDGWLFPGVGKPSEVLRLPRSFDTESTLIVIANSLGNEGWERIYSRLRVLVWDPFVEEQVADLRRWDPPVPGAILGVIESCHRRGEVLNLDFRAVLDAVDALKLGMAWEDALRASFYGPTDQQLQEDASAVLDWLIGRGTERGRVFTERDLYQELGALRGERNRARRTAALDYLVEKGWIERFLPPAVLRPGRRGRRPGPSYRVLRLPKA